MSRLECIADRFAMTDRQHAIDLATGLTVTLVRSAIAALDEHREWVSRCDECYGRHAFGRDNLVDFGRYGQTHRFEAWQPASIATSTSGIDAIEHIERRVERALAELFEHHRLGSRVLCVFGPTGSGKSRLLLQIARSARLQGFVPLSATLVDSPLAAVVHGRSVCLLDDEGRVPARVLVDLVLRSARPHVVLSASREDVPGIPSLMLAKLPVEALVAAVVPRGSARNTPLRREAIRADGNPGRFVNLICRARSGRAPTHIRFDARRDSVSSRSRAAEQAPLYGEAASPQAMWPVPGEVAALQQQIQAGIRHLDEGRHAPGERELRQAIGGLNRRGEWTHAAEGSLALASSLLKRGRPQDAKNVIDGAREACRRADGERFLLFAAALSGTASIDMGRLDDAETILSAAWSVAARGDNAEVLAAVSVGLARARFWRGQYADADDALRPLVHLDLAPASRVRADVMRARIAVAHDDVASAVATSAEAVERADALTRFDLVAIATCASAFAHLAAGDLAAVRRDVAACAAAARATRDPLRRIRAELVLCEHLRQAGLLDEARRTFAPLRRLSMSALPRIVRSRRDMLGELLTPGAQPTEVVAREMASSGLRALALFVPKAVRQPNRESAASALVDDAISLLRICQTAADETTIMSQITDQVLRQTHAAAAAFFVVEPGGLGRLVSHGRIDVGVAQRAIEAGVVIAPHRHEERVEAASPVKYAGAIIGALAIRWVVGSSPAPERVASVCDLAIAAAAPVLASVLAGRRRAEITVFNELLGVSDAMVEVRRAVERAAAAPFAVLIEGESGSGKELVARAIHKGGPRRDRPFVTLNCAALPDDLVESELFGHARGAFTGAVGERIGVFEEAHTGTLFLDEVGELSPRAQAKLLRVIQEGELRRIGENTSRRIDVRIVSATNRELRAETAAARFRLDLLYRLDVLRISVPPLRDRREDVPVLAEHIWREATARCGSRATLGAAVLTSLAKYDWPGNVRELQNVLAALAVRAGRRGIVPVSSLPPMFNDSRVVESSRLDQARRVFEENFVRAALARCGGRRVQAASELGLTRQGLAKLMDRLGIADAGSS